MIAAIARKFVLQVAFALQPVIQLLTKSSAGIEPHLNYAPARLGINHLLLIAKLCIFQRPQLQYGNIVTILPNNHHQ